MLKITLYYTMFFLFIASSRGGLDHQSVCQILFCAKKARKIIVPPKEMLLLFAIGTFLTKYDVKKRKLKKDLLYST